MSNEETPNADAAARNWFLITIASVFAFAGAVFIFILL